MERALDSYERVFKFANDIGPTASICYVFFLSSAEPITKTKLQECMTILVKAHPLLRMSIQTINGELRWKEMKNPTMDICVDQSDDWHSVFSGSFSGTFPVERGPLWGLTLMPNAASEFYDDHFSHHAALVWRFMHGIADGLAVIELMNDLQDLLVNDETTLAKLATPFEMPKSLQHFAVQHSTRLERWLFGCEVWGWIAEYLVKPLMYRLLPPLMLKPTAFEKYVRHSAECARFEEATTRMCHVTLSREELMQVRAACRLNHVTISSACETAGNIAMCEVIAAAAREKGVSENNLGHEGISVAPVHRKRLPESSPDRHNYLVNHAYLMRKDIQISDWKDASRFWELAHEAHTFNHGNLISGLKSGLLFSKMFTYCLSDPTQHVKHFKPENRWYLLHHTNHGDCNFLNRDRKAGIKVGGLLSGIGGHYYGGIIQHYIVTIDNKLIWSANYPTNVTDRAFAERYLKRCVAILKQMCDVK